MTTRIRHLRAEHRTEAFGIGTSTPRLSWVVDTDESDWQQVAYELSVRLPDASNIDVTHRQQSAESVHVAWPFAALASRARCEVRVRITGNDNATTEWSDPLNIEVGLLQETDWLALPVTSSAADDDIECPIRLRRAFTVGPDVARARLYASALGVYQAECNGTPIGDDVLAPGWTSYDHRLRYQTFDVTQDLIQGPNVLGFTVAEGWYRGRLGFHGGKRSIYGSEVGAIAQLEITYVDGTSQTIASDAQWRCGHGPISLASIYDGERFDAREVDASWSTSAFDDSAWHETKLLDSVAKTLQAPVGPPIKAHAPLSAISITTSPSGKTLVDFGQNMSGRVRISATGHAGDTITIRHAEVLEAGELGVRPLRDAAATDTFTLAGVGRETYEPTFTIHGFRYAQVDGYPGELTSENIVAVPCYSDMERTGTFTSSDPDLNKLHENVRWSMLGNFVDIPTDCPQRDERLGWTGDIQVFAPTASFLYACDGFLASWLEDLSAEQDDLGTVPFFVPSIDLGFKPAPSAAWGDAAVIVPWVLYQQFGDIEVLRRQYPSMTTWVDQVTEVAGPSHLWDTGFQFGDWLDPAAAPDNPADARTDPSLVATAHHAHSARLLSEIAGVLGEHDDQVRYADLAAEIAKAFADEYVTPSGRMASDAQTAHALALQFDLIPTEAQRQRAGERLKFLVMKEKYQIGTGFVGTPLVCDALTETGYLDDAYFLLLQRECPSWLYPVTMGATTIWERWDSMLPDGSINSGEMTSFNHYALGAVADFLHRTVAGLAPAGPGYRTLLVRPRPGGGLTSASATHETPYGSASVSWTREGDQLSVEVVVPPSCRATIELPGDESIEVGSGIHNRTCVVRPAADDPMEAPKVPSPFD